MVSFHSCALFRLAVWPLISLQAPDEGEDRLVPRTCFPSLSRKRGRALSLRVPPIAFFGATTSLAGQVVIPMTAKRRSIPFRGLPGLKAAGCNGPNRARNFFWFRVSSKAAAGLRISITAIAGDQHVEIYRGRPIKRTQSSLPPGTSEQTRVEQKVRDSVTGDCLQ
jgi:hypothetical protein